MHRRTQMRATEHSGRRSAWGLVCAAMLTVPLTAPVAPSQLVVQMSPTTVHQGEVVAISVPTTVPFVQRTLRFRGRSWPLYPGRNAWGTYLGTDPNTPPGRHTVTFEGVTAQGTQLKTRGVVTVVRVAFPTRQITFDRQQQILLTPEMAERERTRTEAALRTLHVEQLWEGAFVIPVSGPVTSPYGVLSIYQGQVWGFHGGVDIAAAAGTPVQVANDGIVRLAEALPLSGNAVFVDHGLGMVTEYLHLSAIQVEIGQRVKKGQVIGNVGATGLSLGPHLHWGLRVNGVHVDPLPWTSR